MDLMKLQNGSDVRGVAIAGVEGENVNLTPDIAAKIGCAFVSWLSGKKKKAAGDLVIGVGRDSRISGPALADGLIAGILSTGARVVNCNMATTPAMFMSIVFEQTKYDGSAMITASHLPFNRNGIKFFDADGGLEHEDITAVLEIASKLPEDYVANTVNNAAVKTVPAFDLLGLYAEYLCGKIAAALAGLGRGDKPLTGLHIVVDSGIQSVLDGTFTEEKKDSWDERLATVFNRGFWDGYYQGQTLGEWNHNYGSNATERKQYIGKGVKYFSKLGVAEFTVEADTFSVGDKMLITGPTTGALYVTVEEIHDDVQAVETAQQGTRVSIKVPEKVRPSDKLFKIIKIEK